MSVYFEEEGEIGLPVNCLELAGFVIEEALDYADFPYEAEVSVLLTGNEAIQKMNQEFRGINKATDVLSFPMLSYDEPGNFEFLDDDDTCVNPESGEVILGDIVISKEKVLEQAGEYGHSPEREYAFLIAHSMLHLFGYDHMEESERMIMEEKQEEILSRLHIFR